MKKLSSIVTTGLAFALSAGISATVSFAADKVTFGTNWLAQAGHGGYYQAVADGTYEKMGLDVDIQMGGPQVNNRPMLPVGRLDFLMGGNMLQAFDNVRNGVPTVVVASMFQKDPQVLMAHKGAYKDFKDLTNADKILIGKDGQFSFWKWLKSEYGFKDESLKPYTYNLAPFLADEKTVQQGFATSEPIYAKDAGKEVDVFLLADHGWNTYSTTIETTQDKIKNNPDLVQRFVDGSIIGWYNFLYGDRSKAYELIIKDNPDMTVEKLEKEVELMKALAIVDSGDSLTKGIGTMNPERNKEFHDLMVKAGVIEEGAVDLSKVANYDFINKGVGLDVKKMKMDQ